MGQVFVEARREYVDSLKIDGQVIPIRFMPGINPVDEAIVEELKKKGARGKRRSNFAKAMESQHDPLGRKDQPVQPPLLRILRPSEAQAKSDGRALLDYELYPNAPLQIATEKQAETGNTEAAIASAKYAQAVAEARERIPASEVEGAEVLAAKEEPKSKRK
jgi:hypothetical protein